MRTKKRRFAGLGVIAPLAGAIVAALAALAPAACGGDSAPLGGPYGGTGNPPAPSPPGDDGGSGGSSSGSSSSSGSGGSSGSSGPAPTWSDIFNLYLKAGKIGDCTNTGILCHSQYTTPSAMYGYLVTQSQLGSNPPALVDPTLSCLTWYAGPNDTVTNLMPLSGNPQSAQAVADMNAWAAAGAHNN